MKERENDDAICDRIEIVQGDCVLEYNYSVAEFNLGSSRKFINDKSF